MYEPTWRTGGGCASATVWRSPLDRYVFLRIGRKQVSEITTADVLRVIVPIWHTKTATAVAPNEGPHSLDHKMGYALPRYLTDDLI